MQGLEEDIEKTKNIGIDIKKYAQNTRKKEDKKMKSIEKS